MKKSITIIVSTPNQPIPIAPLIAEGKVTRFSIYSKPAAAGYVALKEGDPAQYNPPIIKQGMGIANQDTEVDLSGGAAFDYGVFAIADSNVQQFTVELEID